jgi:hypothetical protein
MEKVLDKMAQEMKNRRDQSGQGGFVKDGTGRSISRSRRDAGWSASGAKQGVAVQIPAAGAQGALPDVEEASVKVSPCPRSGFS